MKFLIDQQLPPILATWLRDAGFDAAHVREQNLVGASDAAIWAHARNGSWIVITKDEDFVKLWLDQEQGGVLWIRFGNCSNPVLVSRFQSCWPDVLTRLRVGDRFVEVR